MDRILVVDDSAAIRNLMCAQLESLGGLVTEAADSLADTQALLADDPRRFMLAVLDLNLPDAPNGEVVDLVRGFDIPVVVLTATLDTTVRRKMFAKQVVDYEVKTQGVGMERVVDLVCRLRHYRQARILVVDDSESMRLYVCDLLQRHGYQTLQACSGPEAIAVLDAHPHVAMVVTDFHMPGMNGDELTAQIRRKFDRDELAVIGLSSGAKGENSIPLLKSGANDFIAKPFEVEEFYARVDQNLDMLRFLNETREAANRDYLTKLYNRRYFFSVGEGMYCNARRGTLQLGVAVIDLDHFKSINDTHGHDVGDLVLVAVAGALQAAMRDTDVVARFGGEEFICLLSLKERGEAQLACERIRKAIEGLTIEANDRVIPVTASIGVTTDLADSLKGMLEKADVAVYAAKQGGRNQVAIS